MLKINQVIQIAPFAHLPKVWKEAVIIGQDEDYYYAQYVMGTHIKHFKFLCDGYEDDWQVQE